MSIYSKISSKKTPQTEKASKLQVKNSAGGYSFKVAPMAALTRFLILGSQGGTYYIGERELTLEHVNSLQAILSGELSEALAAIDLIADVSDKGRAAKNDHAIFALAVAASFESESNSFNHVEIRRHALSKLPVVCRIPTHLFQFIKYVRQFRGVGRAVRTAITNWYASFTPEKLAYELAKYQSRDGYSNRDVLRLAHSDLKNPSVRWAVNGVGAVDQPRTVARRLKGWTKAHPAERLDVIDGYKTLPRIIEGLELCKSAKSVKEVIDLISNYKLTREMIPTQFLPEAEVQEALLPHMPLHAMVRNLGNMTRSGLLTAHSGATQHIVKQLSDQAYLHKSRMHPLALLIALRVYAKGTGLKGSGTWTPLAAIMDALDEAFYASFANAEPTGKRLMYALDISGSMESPISSTIPLSCKQAGVALAMLALHTEKTPPVIMGFDTSFRALPLSKRQRLDDATNSMRWSGGGTDCSLPVQYALSHDLALDGIVIVTDSETFAGRNHPFQLLKEYRRKKGIPLRQVVIGMTSNGFTIADPTDLLSMDVVGFDAGAPPVINSFLRGEI